MQRKKRFSVCVASDGDGRSAILEATDFARKFTAEAGLSERASIKTLIIVEELISNVVRHKNPAHDVRLTLSLDTGKEEVRLKLDDDSVAFDATHDLQFGGPDPRDGGSVGLAIVRAWSTDLRYARENGSNTLMLKVK